MCAESITQRCAFCVYMTPDPITHDLVIRRFAPEHTCIVFPSASVPSAKSLLLQRYVFHKPSEKRG